MFLDNCKIYEALGKCGADGVEECRKCEFNEHLCDLISDFDDAVIKAKDKMLDKVELAVVEYIKKERKQ